MHNYELLGSRPRKGLTLLTEYKNIFFIQSFGKNTIFTH